MTSATAPAPPSAERLIVPPPTATVPAPKSPEYTKPPLLPPLQAFVPPPFHLPEDTATPAEYDPLSGGLFREESDHNTDSWSPPQLLPPTATPSAPPSPEHTEPLHPPPLQPFVSPPFHLPEDTATEFPEFTATLYDPSSPGGFFQEQSDHTLDPSSPPQLSSDMGSMGGLTTIPSDVWSLGSSLSSRTSDVPSEGSSAARSQTLRGQLQEPISSIIDDRIDKVHGWLANQRQESPPKPGSPAIVPVDDEPAASASIPGIL